jgi:hypothetical protein
MCKVSESGAVQLQVCWQLRKKETKEGTTYRGLLGSKDKGARNSHLVFVPCKLASKDEECKECPPAFCAS